MANDRRGKAGPKRGGAQRGSAPRGGRKATSDVKRVEGVGLAPIVPIGSNEAAAKRAESEEGLTGWIGPSAGPSQDRVKSYPGMELDPETILSIFREADRGYWLVRYADLWDDIRQRDYQLYSLDRGRRVGITTKRFDVLPSDPKDPIAVGLAAAAQTMVDQIDAFDSATYSLLSANGPGYSMQEPIYRHSTLRFTWNKSVQTLYGLHARELRWVHQRHAFFAWDTDAPHLDLGSDGRVPISSLPHKIFFYQTVGDGISSTRGFLRPATWLHLMKNTSLVSGAIFLKIFGIPPLAAYVPDGKWKDASTRDEIENYLRRYGNGEPSIFPEWMMGKIKADTAALGSGAMDLHMKWCGYLDACLAKAVQGAILQSEASGSGPGSYALGSVHEAKSYDVVMCDAIGTCEHTRSTLLWAWIDLNSDALAKIFNVPPHELFSRIPICARRIDRETTPKERAEIACMFAKGGMKLSKGQLRSEWAFDAPIDDDDAFNGEAVMVSSGGAAVPGADAAGKGVQVDKPDKSAPPTTR